MNNPSNNPIYRIAEIMTIDWGVIKLVLLGIMGLSAIAMVLLAYLMVRRKINKEIGYLIRHLQYHPARPVRKLHFEDYGAVYQEQPDQETSK